MTEIVRDEAVLGGEPCIEGTRIGVHHVYDLAVGDDRSPADAAEQLDISLAEVHAALAYYYDNPEEMEQLRREHERARERLAEETLQPPGAEE